MTSLPMAGPAFTPTGEYGVSPLVVEGGALGVGGSQPAQESLRQTQIPGVAARDKKR